MRISTTHDSARSEVLLVAAAACVLDEALASLVAGALSKSHTQFLTTAEVLGGRFDAAEPPALVLLRIDHHDSDGFADLARLVRTRLGGGPFVFYGAEFTARDVQLALEVGACGVLSADMPAIAVGPALELAMSGVAFLPSAQRPRHGDEAARPAPAVEVLPPRLADAPVRLGAASEAGPDARRLFTSREIDVLEQLCDGLQNKLIAYRLGLQEGTVKVYIRQIIRKLNVTSRTQAALVGRDMLRGATGSGGAGAREQRPGAG